MEELSLDSDEKSQQGEVDREMKVQAQGKIFEIKGVKFNTFNPHWRKNSKNETEYRVLQNSAVWDYKRFRELV